MTTKVDLIKIVVLGPKFMSERSDLLGTLGFGQVSLPSHGFLCTTRSTKEMIPVTLSSTSTTAQNHMPLLAYKSPPLRSRARQVNKHSENQPIYTKEYSAPVHAMVSWQCHEYSLIFLPILAFSARVFSLQTLAHSPSSVRPSCLDHERSALLHFKQAFLIDCTASSSSSAYPKVKSWANGDKIEVVVYA